MKRFFFSIVALFLLPLLWALVLTFIALIKGISGGSSLFSMETLALLAGHVIWILIWIFLPHPVKIYVLGHELTHALWGALFGARVSNLKVHPSGGSVTLTKNNFLITLAPYFFPFYTVIVLLAGWAVRLIMGALPCPPVWFFLVGLTWTFHMAFTICSLMEHQPDIQEYGHLFSYVIILLFNLLLIIFWMVATSSLPWKILWETIFGYTSGTYRGLWRWGCGWIGN